MACLVIEVVNLFSFDIARPEPQQSLTGVYSETWKKRWKVICLLKANSQVFIAGPE